ncbi:uncharacterized protein [Watersipora subatra]|uniref:uncharacterized protein n=1 Tax=Watersipora subatra TaxID=2589382 RepID=UPI00355BFDD0
METSAKSPRQSSIHGPIPRYRKLYEGERWQPGPNDEWNPDLPYGGKVYLARKKKAQTWFMTIVEALFILGVAAFMFYAYYYMDNMHFHSLRLVANVANAPNAQHFLGQRYLNGEGVAKDHKVAMQYFKMAADQGHPHASHNLAVGHLKGMHKLPSGEVNKLLQHAAANGVSEAQDALLTVCTDGGCE